MLDRILLYVFATLFVATLVALGIAATWCYAFLYLLVTRG